MSFSLKQLLTHWSSDQHMNEVMKGSANALAIRISSSGLAFCFSVSVARLLGAEGAGLYFLALSLSTIGSVIGRVGLDNVLLRFVAIKATSNDWNGVNEVYNLGIRIAITVSGLVALICFIAAPWVADTLFKKTALSEPLRWMSLSILTFAILNLQAECFKGIKRIRLAMMLQGVGVPLIGLIIIFPLAKIFGVLGVALSYLIGTIAIAILGVMLWRRTVYPLVSTTKKTITTRELWARSRPLYMVSLMNRAILPWAPLFIIGIWANSEEVGIFGSAMRVAMLVSFMLTASNNVIAPKFAELFAKGDMEALGTTARRTALLITFFASPIFLLLIFGGHWVMAIYGKEFIRGASVLALLAIGQFVNAFTGPVGFMLMMGGRETETWYALFFSSSILILSCILLIPFWGALGCAFAVMLSEVCKNLILVMFCKKKFGIIPIPFWGQI
jgi:O-antigen/teichoic acid export membrane protein